jgi:hypothetical protein
MNWEGFIHLFYNLEMAVRVLIPFELLKECGGYQKVWQEPAQQRLV